MNQETRLEYLKQLLTENNYVFISESNSTLVKYSSLTFKKEEIHAGGHHVAIATPKKLLMAYIYSQNAL